MDSKGSTFRHLTRAVTATAVLALGGAGCSLNTGPSSRPTQAHIVVTGEASGSLQLVVSTDFYETQNADDGTITQVLNTSETKNITPPYDNTVELSDQGSIVVRLKNTSSADVTVRMQVTLDNGQGYDHQATLPQGQELSYVYVYTSSLFG